MSKYSNIVQEILNTDQTITDISLKYGLYITTLSTQVRKYLNIQTVEDVIRWVDATSASDTRKIISARDKTTRPVWDDIQRRTDFLPAASSLRERLYYIKYNTQTAPACGCGGPLSWSNTNKRFNDFCANPNCVFAVSSANSKRIETNISVRGVTHAYLDPTVRAKRDATMLHRYGDTSYNTSTVQVESKLILSDKDKLSELYNSTNSTFKVAKTLGVSQSHVSTCMQDLGIPANSHQSGFETDILHYIQTSLNLFCEKTRGVIPPKEIDIFIPSHNIGIECNGVYWHSEKYKTATYHKDKTNECVAAGVRLIHIFENEYINTPDIVHSRLSSILGQNQKIGARQCTLREVPFKAAFEFFNATHIQGGCKTMSTIFGLYYKEELLACMSFSKSRFNKHVDFELVRYSSKLFTNVVGGASRLFAAFVANYPTSTIISYSDNRWNTGSVYGQLGFIQSHVSSPNYFYFKNGYVDTLMSRVNFQKHKLAALFQNFDETKSEYENMVANGYNRIWDCGNTVWLFTPTSVQTRC